jgi:hypothetical protein
VKLSFDGHGINGGDEYKSRIATFTDHGKKLNLGPLFEAAPELLAFVKECARDDLDRVSPGIQAKAQELLNKHQLRSIN